MIVRLNVLFLGFFLPICCDASPIIIFNADRDCESRHTSTGIRYVPECDFHATQVNPTEVDSLNEGSSLEDGLFKSQLEYQFSCESLRPLSIYFALLDGFETVETGVVAGTKNATQLVNTMSHSYHSANFVISGASGVTGFQAIKPGCKMLINHFISYPEPKYFNEVVNSKIAVDQLIATLLQIAQPGANYVSTLSTMQNGITLLNFLGATADELTKQQIKLTVTKLDDALEILSQQCGLHSSSQLCTQAIANTRNTLVKESESNLLGLLELESFLGLEIESLANSDALISKDLSALQQALATVSKYLAP